MKLSQVTMTIFSIFMTGLLLFFLHQISKDAHKVPAKQPKLFEQFARQNSKTHWKNLTEDHVTFTVQCSKDSTSRMSRHGILVKRPEARAVILICHGFMCNKDDVRFLRTLFQDYTTLTFDFRAHGDCIHEQVCTLGAREMYDVMGAVDFIKSQPDLKDKPLIVYGFSMGAVASILAQAETGDLFDAAIWDCPFDSTDNVIARSIDRLKITIGGYEFKLPGRELLKKYCYNSYVQDVLKATLKTIAKMDASSVNTAIEPVDTVAAAKKIKIPALFITCKNDAKAPIEAVTAVYKEVQSPYKRLWLTNGRFHYDSLFYSPEKYAHRVKKFIERFLDKSLVACANCGIWDDATQDEAVLKFMQNDSIDE